MEIYKNNEQILHLQIQDYSDKFKQVQETLQNSNLLFTDYKKQINLISKKSTDLEIINKKLEKRCVDLNLNVLELVAQVFIN